MPIDAAAVGAYERQIVITGDPLVSNNRQNVILASGDAKNIAGQYAALTAPTPLLENPSGTFDLQRAAVGSTGIAAVDTENVKATFSCGIIDFLPYATATDYFTLVGSGTKVVRVRRIGISGFATGAISKSVQLIKRTAANTGGTTAQPSIAQHDSNDAAPTAVVNTYSVIPGALGAGVVIRSHKLNLGATGAAGSVVWDFGGVNGKGLVLRGIAQCLALNGNGVAIAAGTLLDIWVEWTEE